MVWDLAGTIWSDLRKALPLALLPIIIAVGCAVLLWWPVDVEPTLRLVNDNHRALAGVVLVLSGLTTVALLLVGLVRGGSGLVDRRRSAREEGLRESQLASERVAQEQQRLQEAFDGLQRDTLDQLLIERRDGETCVERSMSRSPDGEFFYAWDADIVDNPLFTFRADAKSTVTARGDFCKYDVHPYALKRLDEMLEDPEIQQYVDDVIAYRTEHGGPF